MLLSSFVLAMAAVAQGPPDWHEPFPAHKVIGNVYYVGSRDLATYLITTGEGHILINSGFERTVPLIQKSVESLGFKMTDVKILLASHAHSDHVAGHAALQKLTGARVCVMRGDDQVIASGGKGQYLYPTDRWDPCKVDRVLNDRDEVKLGGVSLTARLTPGHTRGCTTWTWKAEEGGKKYDVVVIGSPNVNPGFQLVNNKDYPEIAGDFARTFEVLKSLPCDVFLGAHGGSYGMIERHARLKKGQGNPFVNPDGYKEYVALKERAFRKTLADQQDKAHNVKSKAKDLHVLFIGNSQIYSNDLPRMVEALAESAPVDQPRIRADRFVAGGASLERLWNAGDGKDTARAKILEKKWDCVILQDIYFIKPDSFKKYAPLFHEVIQKNGSRTILFCTASISSQYPKGFQELHDMHIALRKELQVPVAAAGKAWLSYWGESPTAEERLVLYHADKAHPGVKGSYIYACTLYSALTGHTPVGLTNRIPKQPEDTITAAEARRFQEAAWRVNQDTNRLGGKLPGK